MPAACRRRCGVALTTVFVAASTVIGSAESASAQTRDASPSAEDVRAAARKFTEGERAFRRRDYLHAAEAFEAAYDLAPDEDVLWNAARARHRAGDLARAANLYARYLRDAKPSAPDRDRATAALNQLRPSLARIDVQAPPDSVVTIDGASGDTRSLYVNPGAHVVRERRGDRVREKLPAVAGGQVLSVAFGGDDDAGEARDAPAPPPTPAPTRAPAPAVVRASPPERAAPSSSGVVPPWVFGVEAAVTVVFAAATIASGLDTRAARNDFVAHPTDQGLADGKAKEVRTNVLLGVTAGLGVLTAVTGLWLVRWHGIAFQAGAGAAYATAVF